MWASLRAGDDALAPFRDRVAVQLSALSALLLLPFTALHLWHGRWALGALIAAAQVVLAVNARALRAGRAPVVPLWLMTASFLAAVCGSVSVQGVHGILWSYPALFICYFLLARRLAMAYSLVMGVAVTTLAAWVVDLPTAARVGATLTLTVVMINVVLGVIGDQQRALLAQTLTDPLTGAFNRRHLQTRLDQLAAQAAQRPQVHALLAIDIDHFKRINDRFGHAAGDEVLRKTVQVLSGRKRRGDTLFRTGGEEFCLLLPDTPEPEALKLAEELRERVSHATLLPGLEVTVSIGVSLQRSAQPPDEWMRQADKALYAAKHLGRNRVVLAAA
jgi:diguanylate cyclase (GGDEF)-like protein